MLHFVHSFAELPAKLKVSTNEFYFIFYKKNVIFYQFVDYSFKFADIPGIKPDIEKSSGLLSRDKSVVCQRDASSLGSGELCIHVVVEIVLGGLLRPLLAPIASRLYKLEF